MKLLAFGVLVVPAFNCTAPATALELPELTLPVQDRVPVTLVEHPVSALITVVPLPIITCPEVRFPELVTVPPPPPPPPPKVLAEAVESAKETATVPLE
jgi:hypothetical protein